MSEVKKKKKADLLSLQHRHLYVRHRLVRVRGRRKKKKNTIHESIFVLGNNMSRLS